VSWWPQITVKNQLCHQKPHQETAHIGAIVENCLGRPFCVLAVEMQAEQLVYSPAEKGMHLPIQDLDVG
jgi:hypothetical protein